MASNDATFDEMQEGTAHQNTSSLLEIHVIEFNRMLQTFTLILKVWRAAAVRI